MEDGGWWATVALVVNLPDPGQPIDHNPEEVTVANCDS
jgi:hypothetical protein